MYTSCTFHFNDGEMLASSQYSLDQLKKCLTCKYFEAVCQDYRCNHSDGFGCMCDMQKHHEFKSVTN